MIDIDTLALLATTRDALAVPPAATAWGQQRRNEVRLARATAVQRALDYAVQSDDLAGAVEMVEDAVRAHPVPYVCVCDIEELPDLAALKAWAASCGVGVVYAGPDAWHRPVYAARCGVVTRVTRGEGRDPHPIPVVWASPLARGTAHR